MKDYPIETDYFDECKKRVALAVKIDKLEHQTSKERSNTNWYEKHAKLLDIELDDEIRKETWQDDDAAEKAKRNLLKMKRDLNDELQKIIFPKFMSKKYLMIENVEKVMNINSKFSHNFYFKTKVKKSCQTDHKKN
jgi:hypothetical protein